MISDGTSEYERGANLSPLTNGISVEAFKEMSLKSQKHISIYLMCSSYSNEYSLFNGIWKPSHYTFFS
jgi:hypothetical protein